MKNATLTYVVFVAMALLSILLMISSALLWLVFPRGFYPARRLWIDLHKWGGLALTVLVVTHVARHGRWVVRMSRRYLRLWPASPKRAGTVSASAECRWETVVPDSAAQEPSRTRTAEGPVAPA